MRIRLSILVFLFLGFLSSPNRCVAQNNLRLRYLDRVIDTVKDPDAHLAVLTYTLLQAATEDSLYFVELRTKFRKTFVARHPGSFKTTDALLNILTTYSGGDKTQFRPDLDSLCATMPRTDLTACCWIDYIRLYIRNESHEEYEHGMLDSSFHIISANAERLQLYNLSGLIYTSRATFMAKHESKPEYLGLIKLKYELLDTAVEFFRSAKNQILVMKNVVVAARYYGLENNFRKCQALCLEAQPKVISLKDTASEYLIYSLLTIGNTNLENYDDAMRYALQMHALSEIIEEPARLASSSGKLSEIYAHLGDTAEAIRYGLLSIMYNQQAGNKYNAPLVIGNYGEILFRLGFLDSAKHYQKIALDMRINSGNREGELYSYNCLAEIALAEKDYATALSYCHKSQAIEDERQYQVYNIPLFYNYYKAYSGLHNFEKSVYYLEKYVTLKASRDSLNNASELVGLQANFDAEVAKKNFEQSILLEKLAADAEQKSATHTRNFLLGGLLLLLVVIGFILFGFTQKRKANRELSSKNSVIERQKEMVEEKQKEILDSITYAKRIQYTLLAPEQLLQSNLPEYFVLFKPKDIVSGDFYWATRSESNGAFYLAVCDSTGHGVPGAFMSLLNISFLNEAIVEKKIDSTNAILNHVRQRLSDSVSKDGAQDGMDGTLVCFDKANSRIKYSAAHNAPILISDGEIRELSTDKMPIGKGVKEQSFTEHSVEYTTGDMLYLFTDGYADQFGGPKGKKFKYKQLHQLMLANHLRPLAEQREIFEKTIEQWRGNLEQVDDICVVGIRI